MSTTISSALKRSKNSAVSRDALLDAAQTIFARHGFYGGRIDDIAQLSGYNKSLIFQYFGDKHGLYNSVIKRLRVNSDAASIAALGNLVDQNKPLTRTNIERLLKASVAWSFSHLETQPEYLRLFNWEMAQGWTAFETVLDPDQSSAWGIKLLKSAQKSGVVRTNIDPRTIIVQLTLMPLSTLSSIERFKTLYRNEKPQLIDALRAQVTKSILHLALPDK
jgi:TetR/AcrR family transcriptional regulator